jgi:hypothetical protein
VQATPLILQVLLFYFTLEAKINNLGRKEENVNMKHFATFLLLFKLNVYQLPVSVTSILTQLSLLTTLMKKNII